MTHPMQPTDKQCAEWWTQSYMSDMGASWTAIGYRVARLAYAAGADAELKACVELLSGQYEWDLLAQCTGWKHFRDQVEDILRSARRPTPTPQQQALAACAAALAAGRLSPDEASIIRCALEAQP